MLCFHRCFYSESHNLILGLESLFPSEFLKQTRSISSMRIANVMFAYYHFLLSENYLNTHIIRLLIERIRRRREQGLQDRHLYNYTFANDNGQNPLIKKAHAYVESWDKAYAANTGLLLFGDVGTGKSFFAGCIANALLDKDVSVMMTNFPTILSRLTGMFPEERIDYIDSIGRYDLLILDDFGVERNTSYAMEQMFHIVDRRYRSCKPLIVTTNLTLEQMKNPSDLEHSRIYGRILEHCAPILFSGKDMRKDNAAATKATAREILSAKTTL